MLGWRSKSFVGGVLTLVIVTVAAMLCLTVALSQRTDSVNVNRSQNEDRGDQEARAIKAMNNKRMSQEDIVRLLKEGKEKGYITGNLPTDPAELEALAQQIHKDLIYQPSQGETGVETGRQQLIVKRQPTGDWNEITDRRLPLFFEGPEWSALFHDVLHANDRDPLVPGEAIDKWSERQRTRFQNSILEYPMLGRIWDTYIDVHYQPGEVSQLRDECLRVKSSTSNSIAISGLDKLIAACDDALKDRLGLSLLSE
jgi:hypothetical protein